MSLTQSQIAKQAGVSRGTVDRVINNRGHVDPGVEKKIRRIIKKEGYHPNRASVQLMRMKKPMRIGVLLQSVESPFMRDLLREVESVRSKMRAEGTELLVYPNQGSNVEEQICILNEMEDACVDGIAVTPLEEDRICDRLRSISARIPVITVNRDMPDSGRMCYVGQDSFQSGCACAGLMNVLIHGHGRVLTIIGPPFNRSHQSRYDGFVREITACYNGIEILPAEQGYDNVRIAHNLVYKMLSEDKKINGIYFAGNGQAGACDAIRELGLKGKIHMVCHDLTEDNVSNLKDGVIDFLIDQDVRAQAIRPLEILTDYILTGSKPDKELQLTMINYRNIYNI